MDATTERDLLVNTFATAGMLCHHHRHLPNALLELSVRLDLAGAGPLLDQIMGLDWTDPPEAADKRDPKPVPTPKPPPPPKPPKSVCRCPACIASRHPQSDGSCGCPSCISGRPT